LVRSSSLAQRHKALETEHNSTEVIESEKDKEIRLKKEADHQKYKELSQKNSRALLKIFFEKTKKIVDASGDWERKNLLKVYEAVYLICKRDLKAASPLLIDSISTFGAYELMSFENFISITVLCSIFASSRQTIRDKVIKSPEVLSVLHEFPSVNVALNSLFTCDYASYFRSLVDVRTHLDRTPYISTHANYFIREAKVVGIAQFLASYKSVTLESMASAFGVSVPFMDNELSRLIGSGCIAAKIDAVSHVVHVEPGAHAGGAVNVGDNHSTKQQQYSALILKGDLLLNRVQKLAKIISQ